MKNTIRIILKKEATDARGQLLDAEYKTLDIESKELESLLFEGRPHINGKYKVIGAELLNEEELVSKYREESEKLPF